MKKRIIEFIVRIRSGFWKPKNIINMEDHNGWGDSLKWFDYDKRKIVGWLSPKLSINDEIRCRMKGGRIGRFRVRRVEHTTVHDMFFADVSDVGYLAEGTQLLTDKNRKQNENKINRGFR